MKPDHRKIERLRTHHGCACRQEPQTAGLPDTGNENPNSAKSPMKFLKEVASSAGLLITMIYLYHIGYTPRNPSIGGTFILLFSILSFLIVYFIGSLYGFLGSIWLVYFVKKFIDIRCSKAHGGGPNHAGASSSKSLFERELLTTPNAAVSLLVCLLFSLPLLAFRKADTIDDVMLIYTGFLGSGGVMCLILLKNGRFAGLTTSDGIKAPLPTLVQAALVASMIIAPFALVSFGPTLELSMRLIGIRSDNAPIRVSHDNFATIASTAQRFGIDLKSCPIGDNGDQLVLGAHVLRHAIGDSAYIRISTARPDLPKSAVTNVDFEIKDEGLAVIHVNHLQDPCGSPGKGAPGK